MAHSSATFSRVLVSGAAVLLAGTTAIAQEPSCRVDAKPLELSGLTEASGIAVSRLVPGFLWSHNDSGEPVLHAFTGDGASQGGLRVKGVEVGDWEAIAAGPCGSGSCLYIGDIGDNSGNRESITIYRVRERRPGGETASAETMRLRYPDGAQDAEGLVVMPDAAVFVVTKGEHGPVALYRAGKFRPGASVTLERVAVIVPSDGRKGVADEMKVTDATASPDGRWILVRTKGALMSYDASNLLEGSVREALRYDLSALGEAQGEGIAVENDGTIWLSSEGGEKSRPGSVARLECRLP